MKVMITILLGLFHFHHLTLKIQTKKEKGAVLWHFNYALTESREMNFIRRVLKCNFFFSGIVIVCDTITVFSSFHLQLHFHSLA